MALVPLFSPGSSRDWHLGSSILRGSEGFWSRADRCVTWPGQCAELCGGERNTAFRFCWILHGNKAEERAFEIKLYHLQTANYWKTAFYSIKL